MAKKMSQSIKQKPTRHIVAGGSKKGGVSNGGKGSSVVVKDQTSKWGTKSNSNALKGKTVASKGVKALAKIKF